MYYDVLFFQYINGFANHSSIIDAVGIFLADYLAYFLVAFLCIFLFWPKKDIFKNRQMVWLALASAFIARFLVKDIVLLFYNRPRPYVTLPLAHKIISLSAFDNLQSFPSGHALFFFAISAAVYFYNKKLGIFFFIASMIMSLARIFVGVHWPSDIIAGMALGVITAYAVKHIYYQYKS